MSEPRVAQAEPMTIAYLKMRGAYAQIPGGYGTLYRWVATRGYAPAGMPRAVYLTNPAQIPEPEAEFELWAPVAPGPPEETPGEGGCGLKRVPARTLAIAVHTGPYDSIGATYETLVRWIAEHGRTIVGPCEETYMTDPAEAPPEEYVTEVAFPVAER